MSKEKMICNHCGHIVEWYPTWIHEVAIRKIDDKFYCFECLEKIAGFYFEHSQLT